MSYLPCIATLLLHCWTFKLTFHDNGVKLFSAEIYVGNSKNSIIEKRTNIKRMTLNNVFSLHQVTHHIHRNGKNCYIIEYQI